MSKNEKKQEPKVRIAKMSCGNTVIANMVHDGEFVLMDKPMEIVMIPQHDGRTLLTLMDFIPGAEQGERKINVKKDIVTFAKPNEQMANLYEEVTNPSPIAQPEEKKLLLPGVDS